MYISAQNPTYGYAKQGGGMPAAKVDGEAVPSRGERIVSRLDKDGDGKLGHTELAEGRIGKKMTVERFARLDGDADGMLSAAELDAGRPRGRGWGYGGEEMMKNLVTAKMADYLTQKVPAALPGEDLVNAVIARLDADGSGALNSEEIAGTRLAERIGAGFYDLDADKSGTLDTAELGAFVRAEILGLAEPAAPKPAAPAPAAAETAPLEGAESIVGAEVDDVAEVPGAAVAEEGAEVVDVADATGGLSPADQMLKSLETALKLIESGQETRSTYDVVSALYGDAQKIFAA